MLRNYIKFFIRFFHFCCYVFLCLTVGTSCWFVWCCWDFISLFYLNFASRFVVVCKNVLYCQIVR